MLINRQPIHREVLKKVNNTPVSHTIHRIFHSINPILAEQQQQQQGFEQQGQHGFVQNVQYQSVPQYGATN